MSKLTSLYLDFLRVIAAFGVLLFHARVSWFSSLFNSTFETGNKFVMIFFVLSGYLISYTVKNKNKGSQQYLIDRFSRLYSVVLPALILTFLLDTVGRCINPGFYIDKMAPDYQFFRYFINLIFLSQSWNFSTKPSTNGPFWSMPYEFWYYMLFWAWVYLKGLKKIICLILICALIGFKILLLFPVWMFGVIAYNYSNWVRMSKIVAKILFVCTAILIILLTFYWDFSFFSKVLVYGYAPFYYSSNFIFDWIFGIIVALNLISMSYLPVVKVSVIFETAIKKLSSITFSLYLYHMPMLILIAAVIPYNRGSYWHVLSILFGVIIVSGILSEYTEKRRYLLKHFITKSVPEFEIWAGIPAKKIGERK